MFNHYDVSLKIHFIQWLAQYPATCALCVLQWSAFCEPDLFLKNLKIENCTEVWDFSLHVADCWDNFNFWDYFKSNLVWVADLGILKKEVIVYQFTKICYHFWGFPRSISSISGEKHPSPSLFPVNSPMCLNFYYYPLNDEKPVVFHIFQCSFSAVRSPASSRSSSSMGSVRSSGSRAGTGRR
jgi:hypothetical protein